MKKILLTGGSRGLGLELVRRLLRQSFAVVSLQRTITPELQELLVAYPQQLNLYTVDLANVDTLENSFREVWFAEDQPVDGLINNAAMAYDDIVSNLDLAKWQAMQQVNLVAPMLLTKLVIRRMLLHRSSGSLVHISSVAAHTGFKGLAMYGASKGGLEAFSRGVAREWGARQIRSNCVVPGFMETEMSSSLSLEQRQRIYQRTALQQPTDLSSVAETVLFLLSESSRSITGQRIFVDAGTL